MIAKSQISIGEFTFDLSTAGHPDNTAVVLLHGFPESNHMWTRLMEDLAQEGYYCVAPNLRGYSSGARPKGKANYAIQHLTRDIIQISEALNLSKLHLVGHDWGALIGWYIAEQHPELLFSWSALSVPHAQAFAEAVINDPRQKKMSTYIRRFQMPWLPEYKLKKQNFALLKRLWKHSSSKEVDDYISIFETDGALTAAINYYRGNYKMMKQANRNSILGKVLVPTILVWGEHDPAIGLAGINNCSDHIDAAYELIKIQGGHWLIQTHYNLVAQAIIQHLKKHSD